MTITMPGRGPARAATGLSVAELEQLVTAPRRPCAAPGSHPEDWFPPEPGIGNQPRARDEYEARARALCRFCPVELACLELALRYEGTRRGHGIFGGLAPWQRQRIALARARRRGRPAPITVMSQRTGPVALCPACCLPLDGGPVVFICGTCGRGVMAADVSTEYVAAGVTS
jgi:hypothetical protein